MKYLYIAILLTMCALLSADNQLDVVWQMQGEQLGDHYGKWVTALDFNGDGIDDLAVSASKFHPDANYPEYKGKLYIYFGSDEGLPDTPSLAATVEADTTMDLLSSLYAIVNLGDMNNDGCEDIGYKNGSRWHDQSGSHTSVNPHILLGGGAINIDEAVSYEGGSNTDISPLGDINEDGYDDAGITEEIWDHLTYSIVYGGSFEKVTFVDGIYTRNQKGFRGLGDVNGDGFDDFCYIFEDDPYNGQLHYHNYFFFGNAIQDTIPDYRFNLDTTLNMLFELNPAGDWNGDGYDDFVLSGYDVDENNDALGCRFWRGGEAIHWDWYGYMRHFAYFNPSFGDLNGDGKGDLVDPYILPTGQGGYLYIYIGDQNGTWDYNRYTGEDGYGMNMSHAVGDFNNDGYDDIAIGAYGQITTDDWGYVFVYGGHPDLEEVDIDPVDDETVPPADITFNAYPNPFNPEISFEIKSDKQYKDLRIEIYNVKGQKIDTIAVDHAGETVTWKPKDKASGVYTCKLAAQGKELGVKKITLLK